MIQTFLYMTQSLKYLVPDQLMAEKKDGTDRSNFGIT